jgi:hypothetical protein
VKIFGRCFSDMISEFWGCSPTDIRVRAFLTT